MNELRIVERNGEIVKLSDLKVGDDFNLYEPDGTFIGAYLAKSEPSERVNGAWVIQAEVQLVKSSQIVNSGS